MDKPGLSIGKVHCSRLKSTNIFDDSMIFKLVNDVNSYHYENGASDETVEDVECSSTCTCSEDSPPPILPKHQKMQVVGVCRIGHRNQQTSTPFGFTCEDTSMILLMSTMGSHVRTSNCRNITVTTHINDWDTFNALNIVLWNEEDGYRSCRQIFWAHCSM